MERTPPTKRLRVTTLNFQTCQNRLRKKINQKCYKIFPFQARGSFTGFFKETLISDVSPFPATKSNHQKPHKPPNSENSSGPRDAAFVLRPGGRVGKKRDPQFGSVKTTTQMEEANGYLFWCYFGIYFGVIWYSVFFWYLFWRYIKILVFWWYLKCSYSYNWKIFMYWAIGHITKCLQYMNVYQIYVEHYSSQPMCCISIHLKSKRKCSGPTWLAMLWSMWEKKTNIQKLALWRVSPNSFSHLLWEEYSTQRF